MNMGLDSVMLDSSRAIFLSILTARTELAISDCGAELDPFPIILAERTSRLNWL